MLVANPACEIHRRMTRLGVRESDYKELYEDSKTITK